MSSFKQSYAWHKKLADTGLQDLQKTQDRADQSIVVLGEWIRKQWQELASKYNARRREEIQRARTNSAPAQAELYRTQVEEWREVRFAHQENVFEARLRLYDVSEMVD